MKMIKRVSMLLVVAIVALTLVACKDNNTDKQDVAAAKELLVVADLLGSNESATAVISNLILKTRIGESVDITWSSNKKESIADNGRVFRSLEGDVEVELTATLTKGKAIDTKKFEFTVLARDIENEVYDVTAKYAGETGNMTDGNNAGILGLDPEIFNVVSTERNLTPRNLHVGLNKSGQIRLYGEINYESKNTLAISIKEGFKITGIKISFLAGSESPTRGILTLGDEEKILEAEDIVSIEKTYDDLSIDGFSIRNGQQGGSKNNQIWIDSIKVTYKHGESENKFTPIKTNKVEFVTGLEEELKDYFFEEGDNFVLPTPVKEGEDFMGWYLEETFETLVTEDYELTKDIKLYAKFGHIPSELKYSGDTKTMGAGNNADLVGLNKDMFTVLSTETSLTPKSGHIGLNKDETIRLYGNLNGLSKNTLSILIKDGNVITGLEFKFKKGVNPSGAILTLGDEEIVLETEDLTDIVKTYKDLSINGFSLRNNQKTGETVQEIWIESIIISHKPGTATNEFTPLKTNKVTFNTNGGNEISDYHFEELDKVVLPNEPTKGGFFFEGWFTDKELTLPFDVESELTKDLVLYAKWGNLGDKEAVESVRDNLLIENLLGLNEDALTVTKDLSLPTEDGEVSIAWESNDIDSLDNEGRILRSLEVDVIVTIKAIITKGTEEVTKDFEFTILKLDEDVIVEVRHTEDFENLGLTNSYQNEKTVTGANNIDFTYHRARNKDTFGIDGEGMLFQNNQAYVEFILPNGFNSLSFDYRAAFTSTNNRKIELLINDEVVTETETFNNELVEAKTLKYETKTEGPVTVKIQNAGVQVTIDNITWTEDVLETVVDVDTAISLVELVNEVFEDTKITLPTRVNGVVITWESSNKDVIDNLGNVVVDLETKHYVTLTGTFKLGTTTKTKEFIVAVGEYQIIDISDLYEPEAEGEVRIQGVVTGLHGNNAFIEDETGAVYVTNIKDLIEKFVIGNEVIISGEILVVNSQVRVGTIGRVELVGENVTTPDLVELTTLDELVNNHSRQVNFKGLTIKNIPTLGTSGFNVILTDGTAEVTLRVDNYISDFGAIKDIFTDMEVGQEIELDGVFVGMYNTEQFITTSVDQIIPGEISDEVIAGIIKEELTLVEETITDLELVSKVKVAGVEYNITWTSSNLDVITNDGKVRRPAIGAEDALVTMTAQVTNTEMTFIFDVKVAAEQDTGGKVDYEVTVDRENNPFTNNWSSTSYVDVQGTDENGGNWSGRASLSNAISGNLGFGQKSGDLLTYTAAEGYYVYSLEVSFIAGGDDRSFKVGDQVIVSGGPRSTLYSSESPVILNGNPTNFTMTPNSGTNSLVSIKIVCKPIS